jgi:hypothetical protein
VGPKKGAWFSALQYDPGVLVISGALIPAPLLEAKVPRSSSFLARLQSGDVRLLLLSTKMRIKISVTAILEKARALKKRLSLIF